jgi:soluble lytic murein transglycosylase
MLGKILRKLKANLVGKMKIILTLFLTLFIQQTHALSTKDVQLYKNIFIDYRNGDFKKGDESIAQLEDQILMGHVQALKLLHPTKHRSSFLELRDWLDKYNNQYEAKRIYTLGVKRKPSGAKNPKKNIYPELNEIFLLKDSETPKNISNLRKIFTSKNYSKKISIYNTVRSRVGRGWPTGALEYLSHHEKYFNDKEKSFLLSKIANGYYLANLDDKAINLLNDPSFISEPYSEGLWIKGLAFYRKGDFQTASRQFLILSKITSSKWLSNAGAYWSFLSSTKDANDNITFQASLDALNTACEPSFNIYSILSCRILDKPIKDNVFNDVEMKKDLGSFLDNDFGRRIQALVEIGELPVAEIELNRLQGRSNDRFKKVILGFAFKNDLSSMQIKTAKYLFEDKAPIQFLYPTPKWIKNFNFNNIDPTIALSMMRQESQFSAFAKSGKSAYGLMQILPSTAKMVNKEHNFKSNPRILFDPKINVETGTKYIESLLEIGYIEGDLLKALISYNAGPGNLSKWMKKTNFNNDSFLLIESIPSRETRIFVERVLTNLVIYELINHNSFNYADELIELNTIIIKND